MGMFEKFKKPKDSIEEFNKDISVDLGKVDSFTLLVGGQFNNFVADLSTNKSGLLNEVEQEAFKVLWHIGCIDIDGFGNNIWNLRKGTFEAFNKDGVVLGFEKKDATVKDRYGLDDGSPKTLEEVGKIFKVTRERIRQIEVKALRKLRHPSRRKKLEDFKV